MLKSTIIASTMFLGAVAPAQKLAAPEVKPAEQTQFIMPQSEKVVAQFSYLEVSHGAEGFGLSITDKTAVFIDFEFPGDLHIRIGF